MFKELIKKIVVIRNFLIYKKWNFLSRLHQSPFRIDTNADFVVSIASYPKRAHLLPAVFEALNTQTVLPQKWILVLSVEEWPDLILPSYLNKLIKRGIEIIWVKNNNFAVKKLVPVIEKYPELGVITFDDELIYGKQVIEKLIVCSKKNKGAIVGHVGKQLIQKNGELKMNYRAKESANLNTPSGEVYYLGGSGTYYPAHSLDKRVLDNSAIQKIVPGRGSDIWFWAAAVANETQQICLGSKTDTSLYFAIPETNETKPKDTPNKDIMENRFQMSIDYFGIREKLLDTLPNQDF
ncbi:glycosyltransferase [Flavobacterium sp.]|uniref:glycosyltransferase n=1 Tax=Flavobacterium sp. TaxID=239 RepID=UPI004047DDBB